jgi:hypothetical protein
MPFLSVAEFRGVTTMPGEQVDRLEAIEPAYLLGRLTFETGWIKARLAKRYAVEGFDANPPDIVKSWLCAIVTLWAYKKLGFGALNPEDSDTVKDAETARAEVKEAADSEDGLFDLPMRQDVQASGISQGGPLGYAEASPYTANDRQREAIESNGE